MRMGARVQAAIEVLQDIEKHHQPAARALTEWGYSHRFAGGSDREVIGNLVYDTLRNRASAGWKMSDDSPRSLVLGTLVYAWNKSPEDVSKLCDGSKYAPSPITDDEMEGMQYQLADEDPLWARSNIPEWLLPSFERVFGDEIFKEGRALAQRAPIDIRVNTLVADRDKVLQELAEFYPHPTPISKVGIRVPLPHVEQKAPRLEVLQAHAEGYFEVQDEGSQIAALVADARPGMHVMDFCAGAGGKTLALAAAMENQGQLYAYDKDPHRLRRIFDRLKRANVRNVQVLKPGDEVSLRSLNGRMDLVLVDAPCSGTGTWRRRPDIKWRLSPKSLDARIADQAAILDRASEMVRPGGRLVYVTCSLLPEENEDQVEAFCQRRPHFKPVAYDRFFWSVFRRDAIPNVLESETALQLTPARHATDGFFVSIMVYDKPDQKPQMPSDFSWDGV